mmetsp:Transcript_9043/g.12036  ORF Transcript_9043/g.12036 Transcript_9043/m.12036 type:complete len:208 (+) Transcript_9043:208-831(+)|eukprot:CAMPEP_0198138470 /NCGR_PEP_ID=MMETSP1443-20131203/1880_1 /TAXON_ID=186043 /ORGANISM="Entomoneis sp., Strain CCMP2396" /LENGTH=207 /DNA_ID=CAMNT_0043800261 /DNA_START=173 /DNA_END=796 /DNA_ORIENTATION=-
MIATAVKKKVIDAVGVVNRQSQHSAQLRTMMIGTDMQSSVVSLQKARPWSMAESNDAKDHAVLLKDLFAPIKRVVLFGVPAPFTGTCSLEHYPGYKKLAHQLKQAGGVDEIICYAVADPYAHHGWSESLGNDNDQITFLADPDASFARAYGVDAAYDAVGLGLRSKRFSMVVEDGKVQVFHLVEDAQKDAELILQHIMEIKENGEGA